MVAVSATCHWFKLEFIEAYAATFMQKEELILLDPDETFYFVIIGHKELLFAAPFPVGSCVK